MSSELAFWSDDFLSARPSSPSFLLAYLVLLEHNGAKFYLNSHLYFHIHDGFTLNCQIFVFHPLGRQTSSFCSQTNFVTNRIIEAKGLHVAFHNRSSFAELKWVAISERLWPHYLGLGSWFFPRELSIHHMPSISLMLTAIGTRQCNLRLIILRFPIDRLCALAQFYARVPSTSARVCAQCCQVNTLVM